MSIKYRKLKQAYTFTYKPGTPLEQEYTVPIGTQATNQTANGPDKTGKYWFVDEFIWVPKIKCGKEEISPVIAIHDFQYYGINVPEEYLE